MGYQLYYLCSFPNISTCKTTLPYILGGTKYDYDYRRMLSCLQKMLDRCIIIFLFVFVSLNSNLFYGITIMKRYLIKYMDDLRIPVLASLLTWWAFILVLGLLGGRAYLTRFGHDIPVVYLIFFILPFAYTIPPLLYQLYKRNWLNVGFLLLVWLSPLALLHISTNIY